MLYRSLAAPTWFGLCLLAHIAAGAGAGDALPPIERAVHEQTWAEDSLLTTPQMEPLEWEPLDFAPSWRGSVGAVILERVSPPSTPFIVNPVSGGTIIDPANFDFGFKGGFDVGVVRYGAWADIEFRYFGVNDWDATQGPLISNDGFTLPIPGFDPATFPLAIQSWYASSLNSVELNLRRNVTPRLALLAGFRYVQFDEKMAAMVGDFSFSNATIIAFQTRNDLYGLQLGGEALLWNRDRIRIESALKAGVFANSLKTGVSSKAVGGGGGGNGTPFWWGQDHTAFVGDLNFVGVFQLNEHWAIRGGYQLLWLSGVATAGDALRGLNFDQGHLQNNTGHSVFFQGALTGLEATW